jgi:hypothetical protein
MPVKVIVKQGATLNRRENGLPVSYTGGKELTVSAHVYNTFKDRLQLAPGEVAPEAARAIPLPEPRSAEPAAGEGNRGVVDADGKPDLAVLEALDGGHPDTHDVQTAPGRPAGMDGDSPDQAPRSTRDDDESAEQREHEAKVSQAVADLASVGVDVDPELALDWTEHDLERVPAVVERNGVNLPKFIKDAQR